MHCLVVDYPQPDDAAQFRAYYEAHHLPLAAQLPGLLRMEIAWPEGLNAADPGPFCIFRALFADAEAMGAALRSEIGARLAADVPNYSPAGARMYHHAI